MTRDAPALGKTLEKEKRGLCGIVTANEMNRSRDTRTVSVCRVNAGGGDTRIRGFIT